MGLKDFFKKEESVDVKKMTPEQLAKYAEEIETKAEELEKVSTELDERETALSKRESDLAQAEAEFSKKVSSVGSGKNPAPSEAEPNQLTEREKQLKVIEEHHPFAPSVRLDKLSDDIVKERYQAACQIRDKKPKK